MLIEFNRGSSWKWINWHIKLGQYSLSFLPFQWRWQKLELAFNGPFDGYQLWGGPFQLEKEPTKC